MSENTDDFDCRTILNGNRCQHLTPWSDGYKDEITRVCTCKALNNIIFPEYENYGKMNEKLIRIKPLFDCPMMQQLRKNGKAPNVMASITKNQE